MVADLHLVSGPVKDFRPYSSWPGWGTVIHAGVFLVSTLEVAMKWMITYGLRPEGAWRSYDENVGGLLATFANWEPPEGVEVISFVHRADGKGGWMLVEADDVTGPSQICLQFIAFHDAEIHPVIESLEMAQLFGETMAWRSGVAG